MRPAIITPIAAAAVAATLLAGCAGMQYHSGGKRLSAQGDHEAALTMLREAQRLEPANSEYRIDMLNELDLYAAELLRRGDEARRAGRAAEAADLYAKALKVQPANDLARRALAGLEIDMRTARMVEDSKRLLREARLDAAREKINAALAENPASREALAQAALIAEQTERQRDARSDKAASLSIMSKPVTLQFRDANLRMVFEALSRTTGLNVILDRDVRADLKTTIFVKDAPVEDTVDLILLQNQLEKRSVNANTLFVFPATPAKQKEYQDLQVRTFQIANADVKYLQTVLKTVLKIKELSVDERSSTIVIRDTADAIAVAAKVIAAHDVAEPEVMLEVEVLEVSHDRLSNLGIQFPESVTLSTPSSATATLTVGTLRALGRNDLSVTPLSLSANFKLHDTDANILASPRIRARNKEKARILIGDRVPTIINTVTPVSTGSGVVTGTVQYQDVGLKLEFEPQIYSEFEVGIRLSLEVSNIVKEIPGPNGSLAYQIGTRNAQTVLRLRDGETQIMGGLITSADRNTAAKLPGLGHLPVIGNLFGNNNGSTAKSEIVLSITPHIVRAPAILDSSNRTVFSGTDANIRERSMQLDPIGQAKLQSAGGPAQPPGSDGSRSAPLAPPVAAVPASRTASNPEPVPPVTPLQAPTEAPGQSPTLAVTPNIRKLLPAMNGVRTGANALPGALPPPDGAKEAQ